MILPIVAHKVLKKFPKDQEKGKTQKTKKSKKRKSKNKEIEKVKERKIEIDKDKETERKAEEKIKTEEAEKTINISRRDQRKTRRSIGIETRKDRSRREEIDNSDDVCINKGLFN
jgi:hypothetical protein